MARIPCTFRQRDVEALVKAVRKSGCEVARVEVGESKIVVVTEKAQEPQTTALDEWRASRARSS